MYGANEAKAAGMVGAQMGNINDVQIYNERMAKLTVRDNIEQQITRAKAEVERLEGIRDRLAPELLGQRIVDLQQAMRF